MTEHTAYLGRVVVVGCPGAGKTWFSTALARRIGARHIERDRLGPLASDRFREAVAIAVAGDHWVFDGPPYYVETLVYPVAQIVIWLDYRRPLVLARAIRRSLHRTFGPLEPGQASGSRLRQWVAPGGPWFAMSVYAQRRREFVRLQRHPILVDADVTFLRFGTPDAAAAWLSALHPCPGEMRR